RLVVLPIWNAFYFFSLYANTDGVKAEAKADSPVVLDRYILAKTRQLLESVTAKFDVYDIPGACTDITRFLDAMNNWFIRRSRARYPRDEEPARPPAAGRPDDRRPCARAAAAVPASDSGRGQRQVDRADGVRGGVRAAGAQGQPEDRGADRSGYEARDGCRG